MTVRELIEALKEFPEDMEVSLNYAGSDGILNLFNVDILELNPERVYYLYLPRGLVSFGSYESFARRVCEKFRNYGIKVIISPEDIQFVEKD